MKLNDKFKDLQDIYILIRTYIKIIVKMDKITKR